VKILGDVGAGHVLGRYELLMPIASGGMATVWAARMKGTRGFQKIVAVKTMLPSVSDDPLFEQMFLDEATLASSIRHPNVAEILDLGEENGVLFLVMEWVDGEPLSVLMKAAYKRGGVPIPIGIRIAMEVCEGLQAAHELRDEAGTLLGVVHRDVSPQNILVTFDGVVKIVDFGVAKAAGRAGSQTTAGQIKGKAAYMSPEQARGGSVDRRTDLFAVGILLYQLTTGRHPFRGDNEVATLYNICADDPVTPPSDHVVSYPQSLEGVVMSALAKVADDRYATARELHRALEAVSKELGAAREEDVGKLMRELLGDRQGKRHDSLKAALRVADNRAAGIRPSRPPGEMERLSHSGFTPVSNISHPGMGEQHKEGSAGGAPRLSAAPTAMVGAVSQPPRELDNPFNLKKSGRSKIIAGAAVALAIGLTLYAMLKPARPVEFPPMPPGAALTPTAATTTETPYAPVPAAMAIPEATATAEPTAPTPAASASAAPKQAQKPVPNKFVAPPKVAAASAAPPAPKPSSTSFVAPVRNPGF
jgi:serine/threonine-protein kinase